MKRRGEEMKKVERRGEDGRRETRKGEEEGNYVEEIPDYTLFLYCLLLTPFEKKSING